LGGIKIKKTYASAGVNIDAATRAMKLIGRQAKTTFRPEVLTDIGFFGSLFEFKGYQHPVLVASVDGVGTKLKIAAAMGKHDTVGMDIVNHCVNDIFVGGAEPLFFLDYIAVGKLVPEQVEAVATGLAKACREVGCALIGGETAEMPGMYSTEDYDLAGFVIGVVEKDRIIKGDKITEGDVIIGLPSSGLHTNGFSLVRKIFSPDEYNTVFPELGRKLGDELLEPHRCYFNQLKPFLPVIHGMAHITGGGLIDNVPRVLPEGLMALFDQSAWDILPVFRLIEKRGNVERKEMYHVFNMGIGMVVCCAPADANGIIGEIAGARIIGKVAVQKGEARVVIK